MSKRPWMPFYPADFLADTLDLRTDEIGAYLLLLLIAWRRPDGAIPDDMIWLKRSLSTCASDMHGNRFNRIVIPLLDRYFVLGIDGKFRNNRLTKELEKAEKFSEKQRQNAQKRYGADNKNNDLHCANVVPMRATPYSQSQSQSQKKNKKLASARVPRRIKTYMPADFRLTEDRAQKATQQGLDPRSTFRDFELWAANAEPQFDWDARWVRWCIRAKEINDDKIARLPTWAKQNAHDGVNTF